MPSAGLPAPAAPRGVPWPRLVQPTWDVTADHAGLAANRADAARWALARIRERPAYAKLRERAREIEELKAQF